MSLGDRDRQSSRYPPQERIYENAEYVDIESPPRYQDDGQGYDEPNDGGSNPGYPPNNRAGSNKMRIMSGGAAPSNAPPKSLLEAAIGRPATQRGLDQQQHQQQGQSSRHNNQSGSSNSRRYDYDPNEDEEMINTTAIDIHPHGRGQPQYAGNQQYQQGPTGLSMDELV